MKEKGQKDAEVEEMKGESKGKVKEMGKVTEIEGESGEKGQKSGRKKMEKGERGKNEEKRRKMRGVKNVGAGKKREGGKRMGER